MSTFTIDADNNITAHAGLPAGADQSQSFSSVKGLAKFTAEWAASRLVDTWNSFAGVAPFDDLKPVKKFTDRKAAVVRIWQAVARLSPDTAEQVPDVVPAEGKAKKSPTKATARARTPKGAGESRSNKKAEVIAMMKRAKGVTLAEIVETTGKQGRPENRVLEERRRGAQLPHRQVEQTHKHVPLQHRFRFTGMLSRSRTRRHLARSSIVL